MIGIESRIMLPDESKRQEIQNNIALQLPNEPISNLGKNRVEAKLAIENLSEDKINQIRNIFGLLFSKMSKSSENLYKDKGVEFIIGDFVDKVQKMMIAEGCDADLVKSRLKDREDRKEACGKLDEQSRDQMDYIHAFSMHTYNFTNFLSINDILFCI